MKTINTNDDRPRGQVGIGTLIIFIAMVLVAAVAAGVLVNTSGLLQSQAEDTGADAQAQVSNQIDVVSAAGKVSSGNVETVTLTVKKSPGSDPIDLSAATIEYTSGANSVTLTHETSTSATEFTTAVEKGNSATVLDDNGERIKITIDASAIESATSGIEAGEEVTLRIVDQSGATTVYGVNVPDVLSGQTYVRV
jgi:flagellin-like protein